jgi:anti-anti-sigma factor
MLSAPDLEREITSALARGPLAVVIDLTEVTFLASHGMGVLVAFQQSTASEVRFAVVADGHVTRRPMSLIGLDEVLDLHPTLAVALEAIKV